MADPLDIRSGVDPGTPLLVVDVSGNLSLLGSLTLLGGPIVSKDQVTDPVQVPGSTVIYTKGGGLYFKAADGSVTQLGASAAAATFPLAGTGLLAASLAPENATSVSGLGNNNPFFARIWVPAGTAITNLWATVRDAGTWDGVTNGSTLGLYTDAGVLVDTIATNNSLWTGSGWVGGALSLGAVAAQNAGRFVYGAVLARGMTVSATIGQQDNANDGGSNPVWYNSGPPGSGATHRRCFYLSATSLPGSFNPVSAGTASTFAPLIAIT